MNINTPLATNPLIFPTTRLKQKISTPINIETNQKSPKLINIASRTENMVRIRSSGKIVTEGIISVLTANDFKIIPQSVDSCTFGMSTSTDIKRINIVKTNDATTIYNS